jgi:hypothetical protein
MHTYIGKGVTIHKRGISEAYTVIAETKSKKTLIIQKDKAILIEKPKYYNIQKPNYNFLINQNDIKYHYEKDINGTKLKIRQIKNDEWKIIGKDCVEFYVEMNVRKELNYNDY